MADFSEIIRWFKDLRSLIDTKPVTRWGVVANADPLLVQLDGDDRPIAGSPSTIIGGLTAGERVLCLIQNRRVTVLGRGGGLKLKVLWSGAPIHLNASQTITLSESITAQQSGVMLVWSEYKDGAPNNAQWAYTPLPKLAASNPGGTILNVGAYSGAYTRKYVYVDSPTQIRGHSTNNSSPNDGYVLRYVISY